MIFNEKLKIKLMNHYNNTYTVFYFKLDEFEINEYDEDTYSESNIESI